MLLKFETTWIRIGPVIRLQGDIYFLKHPIFKADGLLHYMQSMLPLYWMVYGDIFW